VSLKLAHIQVVVKPFFCQQFVVIATLDDFPVFDDQQFTGLANRTQAVSDDETGAAFHEAQQRLLNARLGTGVYATGRLVENEDAGVCQDGAGV
jgi:hypothetical protein